MTHVWILLMGVTIVTTWGLSKDALAAAAATSGTMALAAWKVRLVMLEFMELRQAPRLPRAVFEAWAVATPAAMIVCYLLA